MAVMKLAILAHNIRSVHNVGSILRTADGLGVERVLLSGYSPYPAMPDDARPPHVRRKIAEALHKTALGAEQSVTVDYQEDPLHVIDEYKRLGYQAIALEQTPSAVPLHIYVPPERVLMVLGEEVHGIPPAILQACDGAVVIPMVGRKESFNVSVATGIALYGLIFGQKA